MDDFEKMTLDGLATLKQMASDIKRRLDRLEKAQSSFDKTCETRRGSMTVLISASEARALVAIKELKDGSRDNLKTVIIILSFLLAGGSFLFALLK